MAYIRAPSSEGCFLCEAFAEGADARESLRVASDVHGGVVLNRYPYNNGHVLVAPRRHVPDFTALSEAERLALINWVTEIVEVLRAELRPDGFNIGVNLGRVAGAGLAAHLHVHVVPRWNGDVNFMPVIAHTKVIPQALEELWEQLDRAFRQRARPGGPRS